MADKVLAEMVLEWWNEHQYDTDRTGEYNTYDETPEFVKKAKEILNKKEIEPWNNIHDLINREVKVGDKEGEITGIAGVSLVITFFNVNDGKVVIDSKDIDKYLV